LSNRENVVTCTFLIIPIVHCGKVRISKFDELHQIHPCEAEAPICPCLFISPPMSLMNDGTSNPSLTIPEDVICPQCGIVQHRVNPLAWNSTVGLCTVCVKNGADHLPHDHALLTVRIPAAGKLCTLCERWFPAQHYQTYQVAKKTGRCKSCFKKEKCKRCHKVKRTTSFAKPGQGNVLFKSCHTCRTRDACVAHHRRMDAAAAGK
jgi:hypothetical protein